MKIVSFLDKKTIKPKPKVYLSDKKAHKKAKNSKSKNIKHNTPKYKATTGVIEFYNDSFSWKEVPVSQAFIDKTTEELATWAINDKNALKLTQFCHIKGIPSQTLYRWCDKYPKLKAAKDLAIEIIGNRREIGAIKNKYNHQMISSQQAKYDSSWWSLEVQRAELKAKLQQDVEASKRYTIVLDTYAEANNDSNTVSNKHVQSSIKGEKSE